MIDVMLYIQAPTTQFYLVDLYENESLSYKFQFTDIAELKSLGSFARTFRIPATKNNEEVFRGWFNPNAFGNTFNHTQKTPARIEVQTIPYATGHVQLNRVYLKGEVVHEYEITFYAESPDLIRAIGDGKLNTISTLPDLNHEVNFDNVINGSAGEWQYALVDRGQKWSEGGEAGTRPIFNPNWPLYANDLTPFVNAKWLFDNIVSDAGFVWEGWNGSTALEDHLEDVWVPWINTADLLYETTQQEYFFGAYNDTLTTGYTQPAIYYESGIPIDTLVTGMTEEYDNSNSLDGSFIFTAPFSGYFTFKTWVRIKRTAGDDWPQMNFVLRNPDDLNEPYAVSGTYSWNSFNVWKSFSWEKQVWMTSGERVEMALRLSSNRTFSFDGSTWEDSESSGTGWKLVQTSQPQAGETISMPLNAPDFKKIDFIRDMFKMHNLAIIPDRFIANKIYIEPMASYIGTGATRDWTDKQDYSTDAILTPTTDLQSKKVKFTYSAGADAPSQTYVKYGNRVYGDYVLDAYQGSQSSSASDFTTGDLTIDLVGSSTPVLNIKGTNVVTAKFVDEGGAFVKPGLRYLYLVGFAPDVEMVDDDLPGPSPVPSNVQQNLWVASHYNQLYPTINQDDLNWAPEVPLFALSINPYNNLFNRYYRTYFNDIYDFRARKLEANFKLTLTDVLNFSFADLIWLKDSYWRVLEISDYFIGQEQTCKVTLLKVVNPDNDCEYTIDDVLNSGLVQFLDSNGNPSDGNQICCERYGYTWSITGDKCYAFFKKKPPIDVYQHGLEGFGVNNGTETPFTKNPVSAGTIGSGITSSPTNVNSLLIGQDINIPNGNPNTLAVGDKIKMLNINNGGLLVGKNLITEVPGFHLGGGWYDDDRDVIIGRAQTGVVILSGEGDWADDTAEIYLYIEGSTAKHLTIPDNASLFCQANIAIHRYNTITNQPDAFHYAAVTLMAAYKGGATATGAITTQYEDGSFTNVALIADTTTNVDEVRFALSCPGGTAFPYNNVKITMALNYTQVRT